MITEAEWLIRRKLASDAPLDETEVIAFGAWRCPVCGAIYGRESQFCPPGAKCPGCGRAARVAMP